METETNMPLWSDKGASGFLRIKNILYADLSFRAKSIRLKENKDGCGCSRPYALFTLLREFFVQMSGVHTATAFYVTASAQPFG